MSDLIEHETREVYTRNQMQCVSRLQWYGVAIVSKIWEETNSGYSRAAIVDSYALANAFKDADKALIISLLDRINQEYPDLVRSWGMSVL